MNKFLFSIYRIVVPKPLRTIILKKNLRQKILNYYLSLPEHQISNEHKEVLNYLTNNPLAIFPYPFQKNYSPDSFEVFFDSDRKMRFVLLEGKKLYFKKRWSEKRIRKGYSGLLREQDTNSTHRYLTDNFTISGSDVLADIGAAEGNFSLSVIEKVKKVYLFESDPEWIEALRATFAPWTDKVEIINKKVADYDNDRNIRFDTFYNSGSDITFLKIDVDGAEQKVLNSCSGLFSSGVSLKIALCTYHRKDDEKNFTAILRSRGFEVTPSDGYMIHFYDKQISPPYLRRGLIRAKR